MRIGVDLDNTIVCYDGLFHRVALAQAWIPQALATDKQSVRDHLREAGRNDEWTMLQGMVYGDEMIHAKPFPGAKAFFAEAIHQGCHLAIISHRTRTPYLGPATDLHQAARDWLASNAFTDVGPAGLPDSEIYLEESLEAKLGRIRQLQCDIFVDDLPELLRHDDFPGDVRGVCFDPQGKCEEDLERVGSWSTLAERLLFGTAR